MSKKYNKKKKATTLERATPIAPITYPPGNATMYVPPGYTQSVAGQVYYGGALKNMPVGQSALFSPGVPLPAQPNVNPGGMPVVWRFPVAYNTFPVDRMVDGAYDIPSFEQLKRLSLMDYGIGLCERYWLDMVPKMTLKISLSPESIEAGAVEKDYVKQKQFFLDFFARPDRNENLHSWIRKALINQSRYDGLYIYKNKTRGGKLIGLEIIDPINMKPLLDDWGRTPAPPRYAYQQYPWGIPGWQYTTDQMLYYRETPADDTPFGFSRVERVIFITNLSLRKQGLDMAHYTEGNVPAGLLTPPEGSNWTPDQLDAYEQSWNALISGNLQQLARIKVTQPGFTYTPFVQPSYDDKLDLFWFTIRTAAYGLTPADFGFTANVNKSSGETQQDVTFDRTIGPLAMIYAGFLTDCMRTDFPPECQGKMFVATFSGYEQAEDEAAHATALTMYTGAGILGLSNAAKLANLPDDPGAQHIGRVIMTANGPVFLDDVADPAVRNAQKQAQIAGLQMAIQNPGAQAQSSNNEDDMQDESKDNVDAKSGNAKNNAQQTTSKGTDDDEESPTKGSSQSKSADQSNRGDATNTKKPLKRMVDLIEEARNEPHEWIRADYRRWREIALKDIKLNKTIRHFASEFIPADIHQQLSDALTQCTTADEVREVFKAAQEGDTSFFERRRHGGRHHEHEYAWRQPSKTQLDLEATLARAIVAFILASVISKQEGHSRIDVPGENPRATLLEVLDRMLTAAMREGQRITTGVDSTALISASKNVAGRAIQMITDLVAHLRYKAQSLFDNDNQASISDIEDALKTWAESYAVAFAGDTIHGVIEEEIIDALKRSGVTKVKCITEGDSKVCPMCQANADQGPIPIGTPFQSGRKHAPFHRYCRCQVGPA